MILEGLRVRHPLWKPHLPRWQTTFTWGLVATTPLLAYMTHGGSRYTVALAAGIFAIAIVVWDVSILPVLAIPATLLVFRVSASSSNLSFSDLILGLATLCALSAFEGRRAPQVRALLWLLGFYEATTLLNVIYNPYRANLIEWVHEAFLVGGSLIIGWVVAVRGRATVATSAFLIGSCAIALWATAWSVTHHLTAAYLPLGMQKNYIGDMLCFAFLVAYARPDWLGARIAERATLVWSVCAVGMLASQSKQAMLSAIIAVGVMTVRNKELRRYAKPIAAACVPLLIVAGIIVDKKLRSSNKFNSVHQRETWLRQSLQIWHMSPWFGIGLRWWYTNRVPFAFQPPNGEAEVLTSAGLVGLVGFVALLIGSVMILRRVPRRYGTLALAVVVARIVQGQLDVFWVTAQGSIPWLIAGLCLGAECLASATQGRNDWERIELVQVAVR